MSDKVEIDPVLDTVPCGYICFERDGQIIEVNSTLLVWTNRNRQELIGANIMQLLPKAGQIFFQAQVLPQIELSGELEECYFKILHANNDRIPVLGNFRRQHQDSNIYDLILLRIPKRYLLEDALVKAKKVAERAMQELQESNRTLSRFAGMVAHDLKAPIRHMKSLAEFIVEDYDRLLDENGRDFLQKLQNNALRATHFVDKLLEYGSLNSHSQLEAIDLNRVVSTASENLSDSLAEISARLEIDDLPQVWGFETQLVQLFQNMIGNAIKYRDRDRPLTIQIYAVPSTPTEWTIWICDNGIGIAPENCDRVFKMLEKLHGGEYEGAGIGLATCKWIIQNHQGTIGITSKLDHGSSFYFTLKSEMF
ncbi:MAG: ATP-binding protein [Cyanobacteria bacterium J06607_15]